MILGSVAIFLIGLLGVLSRRDLPSVLISLQVSFLGLCSLLMSIGRSTSFIAGTRHWAYFVLIGALIFSVLGLALAHREFFQKNRGD